MAGLRDGVRAVERIKLIKGGAPAAA